MATAGGGLPVPDRETWNGLGALESFCVNVRYPLLLVEVEGAKVTLMVHVPPPGTGALQLLVCWNGLLVLMFAMVSGPLPALKICTNWAPLTVPAAWVAKFKALGDTLI